MSIINVPINKGYLPNWNTRLGEPDLVNMFVGQRGDLYPNPGLSLLSTIINIRKIHFTPYKEGSYIVVTNNNLLRVSLTGNVSIISTILNPSGLQVQIAENLQNQIAISDGKKGYVYDQNLEVFTTLGTANNFAITAPISVISLNSYIIFLGSDGVWQVSLPNQAVQYDPEGLQKIDSSLTMAKCLSTVDNNLFIFGLTGIERWIPTLNTNVYLFPFQKDTNYKKDFGAISSACVANGINKIYFLSSRFIPMSLDSQGMLELPQKEDVTGISKVISEYPEKELCLGSFYSFRGNYFFQITFEKKGISFIYNQNSNTLTRSDDLIISAAQDHEVVVKRNNVYTLSLETDYKKRTLITERLVLYKDQGNSRNILSGIEVRMVQGYSQTVEPQLLEFSLSLDSQSWLNVVRIPFGLTGERNHLAILKCSVSFPYEITVKIEYYGKYNFTIEKLTLDVN